MDRILIVDDSSVDRLLAGSLLEKKSNAVVGYAADGAEALAKLQEFKPDLVLTDLQMPNLDGLQLVAKIKEMHPPIPVKLMTAMGSEEIAVKAIQAGAASYVPKRKLAQDLCETVANVRELASEHRAQLRVLERQQRWEGEFILENDLELLIGLAGHLLQNLRGMAICDTAEEVRVGVALAEALLNAYYHGNLELPSEMREKSPDAYVKAAKRRTHQPPFADRRIGVSARFSRGQAVFSIRDEGKGFDTTSLPDPTDSKALERPYGRGLFLIRSFMDEVKFNEVGNTVTMIKRATKSSTR